VLHKIDFSLKTCWWKLFTCVDTSYKTHVHSRYAVHPWQWLILYHLFMKMQKFIHSAFSQK